MIDEANAAPPDNDQLADTMDLVAELLEEQGANRFRVQAYRNAAATIRELDEEVFSILDAEGVAGLIQTPTIGFSIAHALDHLVRTGKLPLLERLQGEHAAERIFTTVADIGPGLAKRIHEHIGVETLFELEAAAHDGRLAEVPGIGPKRLLAVRESLAGRFRLQRERAGQVAKSAEQRQVDDEALQQVSVSELLDIDSEYLRLVHANKLPRIAPRRFNPTREAWLPILHTTRDDRHYTALFSNTARAHEYGTTHDWVVIYRDDNQHAGCWTVITARFGQLRDKRIVRGREAECAEHYQQT